MKYTLPILLSALTAGFAGCVVHDDPDPNEVTIGAPTGASHRMDRDIGRESEYEDVAAEIDDEFDSLSDYDRVLTDQERSILRDRAREARDDPDDYLDHLTEQEKANLRARAYDLID